MSVKYGAALLLFFIIFSCAVLFIPEVSQWDISCIISVQNALSGMSRELPIAMGGIIFDISIIIPLVLGSLYFFCGKMYLNCILFTASPFLAYFLNGLVKELIQRPRPPIELQFKEHMASSSYVSRHTFVTACLWGLIIYFLHKYCKNNALKHTLTVLSVFWIFFEGFSRVWMGVHHPSDVIGALILAAVFLIFYINLIKKLNENIKSSDNS